jgi:hypothetical protein
MRAAPRSRIIGTSQPTQPTRVKTKVEQLWVGMVYGDLLHTQMVGYWMIPELCKYG